MPSIDLAGREARLLRAARDVLARYKIEPIPGDAGLRSFQIKGGSEPYVVTLDPEWGDRPTCTCPDQRRTEMRGFCKHVIGTMLQEEKYRCQLLELFL
jgi:hypothetical protein